MTPERVAAGTLAGCHLGDGRPLHAPIGLRPVRSYHSVLGVSRRLFPAKLRRGCRVKGPVLLADGKRWLLFLDVRNDADTSARPHRLELDEDLHPVGAGRLLEVPHVVGWKCGPEDARLALTPAARLVCTMRVEDDRRRMHLVDPDTGEATRLELHDRTPLREEKNWTPLSVDGALHFVYTFDPLCILRYRGDGSCDVVHDEAPGSRFSDTRLLRGGSALLPWRHSYHVGVAHTRTAGHAYRAHLIVVAAEPFRVVYLSAPLPLPSFFDRAARVRGAGPWELGRRLRAWTRRWETRRWRQPRIQYPVSLTRADPAEFLLGYSLDDWMPLVVGVSRLPELVEEVIARDAGAPRERQAGRLEALAGELLGSRDPAS